MKGVVDIKRLSQVRAQSEPCVQGVFAVEANAPV